MTVEAGDPKSHDFNRGLDDLLPETGPLPPIFETKTFDISGALVGLKSTAAGHEPEVPLVKSIFDGKSNSEPPAASDHTEAQPRGAWESVNRGNADSDKTNTRVPATHPSISAIEGGTRHQLADHAQMRKAEGPAMLGKGAPEFLSLIRQLREALVEQGQNTVTKQQFQQELAALRRLIESKGK